MMKCLEALERLKKVKVDKETPFSADFLVHDKRYVDDLLIVEKELQALEILKDTCELTIELRYHEHVNYWQVICITKDKREILLCAGFGKEEFDLLKEVLDGKRSKE